MQKGRQRPVRRISKLRQVRRDLKPAGGKHLRCCQTIHGKGLCHLPLVLVLVGKVLKCPLLFFPCNVQKMDENSQLQVSETSTSASSPLAQSGHPAARESNPPEHEHLQRVIKKLKGHLAVLQNQLAVKELSPSPPVQSSHFPGILLCS